MMSVAGTLSMCRYHHRRARVQMASEVVQRPAGFRV